MTLTIVVMYLPTRGGANRADALETTVRWHRRTVGASWYDGPVARLAKKLLQRRQNGFRVVLGS